MHGLKFLLALAVMGVMSLGGGFLAVAVLLDTDSAEAQVATENILRASALEIVDSSGVVRAKIGVESGDAVLALYDGSGTRRFRAICEESRNRVSVFYSNSAGDDRYLSSLTEKGESLLSFLGENDDKLMTMLAGGEQASSLLLKDPETARMLTAFAGRGQSTIQLSDAENRAGWLASVIKDGRSVMALAKDGKLRVRAMTREDASPELVFLDDERNKTWMAGQDRTK